MNEWAKVVTQPLGLVGFVLCLIFGYLGKVKRQAERRWLSPAAFGLAAVALVVCLSLAYRQTLKQTSNPPVSSQQQTNVVQQSSSGSGSPNVQGVQGDVTVTVDQSTNNEGPKKPTEKKLQQPSH
jgi:hypothetical protein